MKKTILALSIFAMCDMAFANCGNGNSPPSNGCQNGGSTNGGQGGTTGLVSVTVSPTVSPTVGITLNTSDITSNSNINASSSKSNATGGSVIGSGNSSIGNVTAGGANVSTGAVSNNNTNIATGGQGGVGGSSTIASGAVHNTVNTTVNTRGTVGNISTGSQHTNVTTTGTIGNVSTGAQSVSVNTADPNSLAVAKENADAVRYVADHQLRNAPSMFSPPLTSSNDTCMGSASGSASGPGFGVSVGKTYTDSNCIMLKNAMILWNQGMKAASLALLCTDKAIHDALEDTGYTCPKHKEHNSESTSNNSTTYSGDDPIVKQRLGLADNR